MVKEMAPTSSRTITTRVIPIHFIYEPPGHTLSFKGSPKNGTGIELRVCFMHGLNNLLHNLRLFERNGVLIFCQPHLEVLQ
jgi:hypothetical protein